MASFGRRRDHVKMQDFNCPKKRYFLPMMDSLTGKETAVLIIDPICMMIHISGYFLFHFSGHGLVALSRGGQRK